MLLPNLSKILAISGLLSVPATAGSYHGYHSPYSFDANYAHNAKWMAAFPNSTNLTSLSIPGTHDTMTSSFSRLGSTYECQNQHLKTQLEAGIRYIDIRCTVVNNTLLVHHEDKYTGFTYTYVLQTLFKFLTQNPSETILMRLKEESDAINSTLTFEEAFNYYRLNDSNTAPGCAKHFWKPPTPGPTTIPALGELRDKVFIIQNFGDNPAPYGICYNSPTLVIEDDYDLDSLADLGSKFTAITENIEAAGNGSVKEDGLLYLSHLSASVGILPIDAAAGTRNHSVKGENDMVGTWLDGKVGGNGTTGVVIIDFPGEKLVDAILQRN